MRPNPAKIWFRHAALGGRSRNQEAPIKSPCASGSESLSVQRLAKAVAVGVSLLVTTLFADFSTVRYLSLFTIGMVVLWVGAARHAGRRFHELTELPAPRPDA